MRFVSGPDFKSLPRATLRSAKRTERESNGGHKKSAARSAFHGSVASRATPWHDATEPRAFFPRQTLRSTLRTVALSESPCLPIAKKPTLTTGKALSALKANRAFLLHPIPSSAQAEKLLFEIRAPPCPVPAPCALCPAPGPVPCALCPVPCALCPKRVIPDSRYQPIPMK